MSETAPQDHGGPQLKHLRRVDQVTRALHYALREDGQRLWQLGWVEQSCRPILQALLSGDDLPTELIGPLAEASELLEGADARPWHTRAEPLRAALSSLRQIGLPATSDLLQDLAPRAQLIEVDVPAASVSEPAPAPKDPPRGRRKKKRRGGEAAAAAPVTPAAPPPPPAPRFMLGHPDHSGQPLSALGWGAPALVELLESQGVETAADLLLLEPVDHERFQLLKADELAPDDGAEVAIQGTVLARWTLFGPDHRAREMALRVGEQTLRCSWRSSLTPDLDALKAGDEVTLIGRVEQSERGLVLFEPARWLADNRGVVRRPRYELGGIDEDALRRQIRFALGAFGDRLIDPLPDKVLTEGRVQTLDEALQERHVPRSGLRRGRERFVFQELFLHQLAAVSKKPLRRRGLSNEIHHGLISQLHLQFGIELTDSQELAFNEIRRDLQRPTAMTRLLQGDVGTGKALVALLTAVMVAEGRGQVMFLCPDALTAEHRFLFAEPLIRAVGLVPQLIPERPSSTQKDALKRGATHILFTTHEVARVGLPEFRRLGLVVVEERGAYGGIKRDWLAQKNLHPDLLVTTAVPIPSSLVFSVFSDHDLSLISADSRSPVQALHGGPEIRQGVYARIRQEIAAGHQAYVIFPMIRSEDLIDRARAESLAAALGQEAFGGVRTAIYHGSMSQEERWRVFEDFQQRRIDVLIATTVIEEGPGVANATAMIVESADRFDLVRLHRLRGHVSGGAHPGYCAFVLSENPNPEGRELVEMLVRERDGFVIAEGDRAARGDQALLGARAGEIPDFRWVDPTRDRETLMRAREAAFQLITYDPQFRQPAHRTLAELLDITPKPGGAGRSRRRRGRRKKR